VSVARVAGKLKHAPPLMRVNATTFGVIYNYVREWQFNEDTKSVLVIRDAEQRCGNHDFAVECRYAAVLNFYRTQYRNVIMKPFTKPFNRSFPAGKDAYVCTTQIAPNSKRAMGSASGLTVPTSAGLRWRLAFS
jgi:hypothetical protein